VADQLLGEADRVEGPVGCPVGDDGGVDEGVDGPVEVGGEEPFGDGFDGAVGEGEEGSEDGLFGGVVVGRAGGGFFGHGWVRRAAVARAVSAASSAFEATWAPMSASNRTRSSWSGVNAHRITMWSCSSTQMTGRHPRLLARCAALWAARCSGVSGSGAGWDTVSPFRCE